MRLPLVLLAFAAGCADAYSYGAPPAAPSANAPPAERCVAQKRLTVSDSSGRERLLNDVSGDGSTIYAREQNLSGSGLTFYRGQTRLDVDDGLEELGDPLAASYIKDRGELAGAKHLNAISRPLFYGLVGAGVIVSLIGTSQLAGEKGVDKTALVIVGVGFGLMAVGIPFLYFAKTSDEDAARYDMMKKLYLPSATDQEKLPAALAAQKNRAERTCGVEPSPP